MYYVEPNDRTAVVNGIFYYQFEENEDGTEDLTKPDFRIFNDCGLTFAP
jgi:hypothetical protein